ncbi:hypothetical protein DSO57_1005319 [Entomophthora muscae]|uniref:Uncharacterized protein n=1 Tax=Entomophthora muscae TaxID=34485 RepID=A0ACC2UTI8_9FUNG|nr:hypothetical protein DSO57_1005319 [Entomophthora muscae]
MAEEHQDPERCLACWASKLQAHNVKIIHWARAAHQNADCLSCLPTVALVSPMTDILYYKLMEDPYLWGEELVEIQRALKKLAIDIKVSKGQLLKLCGDSWLPYICPSLHMDSVVCRVLGRGTDTQRGILTLGLDLY